MANSYKPGKWSGTLKANVVGDASKTTPTLGDDFDSELANLTAVKTKIENKIKEIKKQITALKNHAETGKMATDYLKSTEKRLNKIQSSTATGIQSISKAVSAAQKDEWKRYKALLQQWEATQNTGSC